MIRAKDIAQAALAKARAEQEAAEAKAKETALQQAKDAERIQAKSPGGEALSKTRSTTSTVAGATVQPVSNEDDGHSPRAAPIASRRRAKSAAPQGRRPVTRQERANGAVF